MVRCSSFRRAAGPSSVVKASSLAAIAVTCLPSEERSNDFSRTLTCASCEVADAPASPPYQNTLHWVRGSSQFAIAVHRTKRLMGGQDGAA